MIDLYTWTTPNARRACRDLAPPALDTVAKGMDMTTVARGFTRRTCERG